MKERNKASVETLHGNTPLGDVPDNYVPGGAGQWLVLSHGLDAGKKLFFYDVVIGEGEVEATIVFVHGNPESSYTWRQVVESIERTATKACRIIAMDHIGFGLSDQASYEMVDMHHAANLRQLVQYLDLEAVTLVIHDWGGAIGVGGFIEDVERVSNLVLMNTTVFPMPFDGMTYSNFPIPLVLPWNKLGWWVPDRLWRWVAPNVMYSPAGIGAFLLHSLRFYGRAIAGRLSEGEKVYRDMFSTKMNARSSKRNVKQTNVWGHGYRYFDQRVGWQDNHDFYNTIQSRLPMAWGPDGRNIGVRAFFGLWDPCGREEVRQQWSDALPQLRNHIETYESVGHFVEEHKYVEIAAGIINVAGLGEY